MQQPPSADDFAYALENTRLIVAPRGRIATFGSTTFHFQLITELMDRVDDVRIREGSMHAERPQVLAPEGMVRLLLEGFGEQAREFADQLVERLRLSGQKLPSALRYGFQFRRSDVRETVVHGEGIDRVADRLGAAAEAAGDPLRAVVQGVDDAWEVCLLKFTLDLIGSSASGNLGDLRGRGLL